MEPEQQWCDQPLCSDVGQLMAGNIKVYSYAEQRYYCTTCGHRFSADQGAFFETLRSDRSIILEALAMLVERNSLRATSRVKQCKPDTILHWLDLAGQHAATVSDHMIDHLHLTQAQVDELWTFVKKNRNISSRRIHPI